MEAIKQIVRIPENHEIQIKIPEYVPENELVEIILLLRKKPDSHKRKINELKKAMNDKHFLKDLNEIADDFQSVDLEGWQEK